MPFMVPVYLPVHYMSHILGIRDSCKFLIVVNKSVVLMIATSVDLFSPLQNFTKICEEFRCHADKSDT